MGNHKSREINSSTEKRPVLLDVGKKEKTVALRAPVRSRVWRNAYTLPNGKCYIENNCYCCGVLITFENWHAGHIVAQSKGGSNLPENIRPVCASCNLSMGAMDMREFVRVCGFFDSRLALEFNIRK
jgi:hypothetical protein